jgi:uncharacterized membrane-anchored protein
MQDKELSVIISVTGWVLGIVGTLIAIIGGFVGYIFSKYREDNDCDHTEIKESIKRIHERIDSHLEAKHE